MSGRLHDRLWTWLTAATLALLMAAAVGWFARQDSAQRAQLRASCERGNVLRSYAAADNAIALQLDQQLAARASDPAVAAAARAAAAQRRELPPFLDPIDCGRTIP